MGGGDLQWDISGIKLDMGAVIDALPRAIVITDPAGRILVWNANAAALYGWSAEEVVGRSIYETLVPVDERSTAEQIVDEIKTGGKWSGDFVVRRADGEPVRVWVTDRPITDEEGNVIAVLGASEDVTEQRMLEHRAADLAERLQLALDASKLGTWRWDRQTGLAEFDAQMEALHGAPLGTMARQNDGRMSQVHPDDHTAVREVVDAAIAAGERFTVEYRVVWPDGSVHWLHCAGLPTCDRDGNVIGTVGCALDITDRVVGEEERQRLTIEALAAADDERVNRERLEFLSRINDAIDRSHDPQQVMRNVVAAAVPRLGDWCSITVPRTPDDLHPDTEIAHIDPAMVEYARSLSERFPYDPDAPAGIPAVIRSGEPELLADITDEVIEDFDASDEARDIVRALQLRSAIAVPLKKQQRVLGAMQFVMTSSRRRYTADDLALAQVVASRIASKLENLRLAALQRSIAVTLQASLLPDELPDIPGIDLAVRYWAAGEASIVGGDLYDVFEVRPGEWAVVVGDVCGTGPRAAAVTGLARHTIASAAWHGAGPAAVLEHLNRTMRRRDSDRFLTAAYATLQAGEHGFSFTAASGGHPLPLLVRADGTASLVSQPGTLIGVFDTIDVTAETRQLESGDVVVFHTDGATDVAPPHGLLEAEFVALAVDASTGQTTAEAVADRIHERLAAILPMEDRDDDIALVVLRVR